MDKKISILGCGWLGLPFGEKLRNAGWQVKGSTTSEFKVEKLKQLGIAPFLLDLSDEQTLNPDFFDADYLLVNIPPSKVMRNKEMYKPLIACIEQGQINKVVFISSTSVYPSTNTVVDERYTDEMADGDNALLDIERLFQTASFETTVVRFGGLVGGERYPGRFFTANRTVNGASHPVNMIHLDDCINIIKSVIDNDCFGQVYNGVADTHPTKKEFYTLAAHLKAKAAPQFSDEELPYKIISNQKIKHELDIRFKHPDLLVMLQDNSLWQ